MYVRVTKKLKVRRLNKRMKIIASAPHFFVTDLMKSLDFYVDVLDFEKPRLWGEPPNFAMPRKDGYIVMLNHTRRD